MNHADRQRWASARTLADVGEITALWLEGVIGETPGYMGAPAGETSSLIPVLAACNRAGYVTTCSQPGESGPGYDGAHWEQRAAVEGFASVRTAARIHAAASRAGLCVIAHDPRTHPRWRIRLRDEVPVTRRAAEDYTWFGDQISRRYIRDAHLGWGICRKDAQAELCGAWQLTVIDPEWGRTDSPLWTALESFAAERSRKSRAA